MTSLGTLFAFVATILSIPARVREVIASLVTLSGYWFFFLIPLSVQTLWFFDLIL